ncbi:hypothetical protein ACIQRW_25830 [Streptomyces sp. NPDC091287]|uniref:hypothetical protein n=1 Tax=Streptomyces sp. NPDC091287 TaxID=3365988 RepID=UPI0038241585
MEPRGCGWAGCSSVCPFDSGGLWTAEFGGVRWVCGFTDKAALARFAEARTGMDEAGATERAWEYAVFRGARLLDEIIPAMGVPTGVAVNVADPDGSMLWAGSPFAGRHGCPASPTPGGTRGTSKTA